MRQGSMEIALERAICRLLEEVPSGEVYGLARDSGFSQSSSVKLAGFTGVREIISRYPVAAAQLHRWIEIRYPHLSERHNEVTVKTKHFDAISDELDSIALALHEAMVRLGVTRIRYEELNMQIDMEINEEQRRKD